MTRNIQQWLFKHYKELVNTTDMLDNPERNLRSHCTNSLIKFKVVFLKLKSWYNEARDIIYSIFLYYVI